jgi:hypothetical protein
MEYFKRAGYSWERLLSVYVSVPTTWAELPSVFRCIKAVIFDKTCHQNVVEIHM